MIVALTHSEGRLEGLASRLEANGFELLRAPLVETRALAEADLTPLLGCPWWLFTSVSAVEAVKRLREWYPLADRRFGAVGTATAEAVRAGLGSVDLTAPDGNAQSLALALVDHNQPGPFAWPRGERALLDLERELRGAGREVRSVVVYRTVTRAWPERAPQPEVIVLASPSAANALPDGIARAARLVALGPTTAAAIQARGWQATTAEHPDADGVLEVLDRLARQASPGFNGCRERNAVQDADSEILRNAVQDGALKGADKKPRPLEKS